MKHVKYLLFAVLVMISGCQSDRYYQHQAAEKARQYLLKNAPELTVQEVHFIRFNDPALLTGEIIGNRTIGKQLNETLRTGQQQICVSWQLPGRKELYMVYGVSNARMMSWSPVRLIRKPLPSLQKNYGMAIEAAREYVLNNLYDRLPRNGYNRVRFTEPEIIPTNFQLNFNPQGKLSLQEVETARLTAEKQQQFSLIWQINNEELAVITGICANSDLVGWSINFGGVLKIKEFNEHRKNQLSASAKEKK